MRTTKHVAAASAALAMMAFANSGHAADLYTPAPEPVASWTGFHIGVGGGYGFVNHELSLYANVPQPDAAAIDGEILGLSGIGGEGGLFTIEGGYDFQFADRFVVGIQGDYTFDGIETTVGLNLDQISGGNLPDVGYKLETDGSASVLGRLGYLATPETLVYGLVGWTWTDWKGSFSGIPGDAPGPIADLTSGYNFSTDGLTFGGGIETMFTPNISGKLEYRYVDYDTKNVFELDLADIDQGAGVVGLDSNSNVQTIRATISWRFSM